MPRPATRRRHSDTATGPDGREAGRMAGGFYGTFTPRLDDKGRITLPARYRGAFSDGAMVVRGVSRCLYVFTTEGFEVFAEDAINAPVTDADRIGPARYMLANSDYQTVDAQGRITLT